MPQELLFRAEYTRKKSLCRHRLCSEDINKGVFQIAMKQESKAGDFFEWIPYHEDCFFKKPRGLTLYNLSNYQVLKREDKTRITECLGDIDLMSQHFGVEYCMWKTKCSNCGKYIVKGEIKVFKLEFDTTNRDGTKRWYHLMCFIMDMDNLGYTADGHHLPGYLDTLNPVDQLKVEEEVQRANNDAKRPKTESQSNIESSRMEIEKQSEQFHKYRELLDKFKITNLREILSFNGQRLPRSGRGRTECLDHLADAFTFGVLEKCLECPGQLILSQSSYKCTGNITNTAKCLYETENPKREPIRIPESSKNMNFEPLRMMQSELGQLGTRIFDPAAIPPQNTSAERKRSNPAKEMHILPMKTLQFFIYGDFEESEVLGIVERIKKLGGRAIKNLTDNTTAVLSTTHYLKKTEMSKKMKKLCDKRIEVLDVSFLDAIEKEKGTVTKTLQLIKQYKISPWEARPIRRLPKADVKLPQDECDNPAKAEARNRKLKEGMLPCDLLDVAHLYVDPAGTKHSATLTDTDVDDDKNSYYKIQLLEADNNLQYWVFRAYGRTGNTKRKSKIENSFPSLEDALRFFKDTYKRMTGYNWAWRGLINQRRRRYVPVESGNLDEPLLMDGDYGRLPESVQRLVIRIFDIALMKKMLTDFKVDTEKNPLGQLSNQQIALGYQILIGILPYFQDGKAIVAECEIRGATNRFFKTIPHTCDSENIPLLDNLKIIHEKMLMLSDLQDLLVTYKLKIEPGTDEDVSPIVKHYRKLKCQITPVERSAPEYKLIEDYVTNSQSPDPYYTYRVAIATVFKVDREGEEARYKPFEQFGNRRLLWHGSRVTNIAGILSQGLRIASHDFAKSSPYQRFGNGVYFADMVNHSAESCRATEQDPTCMVLLCEVALGNMKECYDSDENFTTLPSGKDSLWGVGRQRPDPTETFTLDDGVVVPLGKPVVLADDTKTARTKLPYNEFVIYNAAQVKIKYLVQFQMNFLENPTD